MTRRVRRFAVLSFLLAVSALGTFAAPASAASTRYYVDDDGLAGVASCDGTTPVPTSVQGGIDAASRGDVVVVCPGEYWGRIRIVDKPGVLVRASEPWQATIRPALVDEPGGPLVVMRRSAEARLQHFALEFPTDAGCTGLSYGIRVARSPHAQVRANRLVATGSDTQGDCQFGLGIYVDSNSRHSIIAYNRVTDFGYGGVGISGSPDTVVRGNTFRFVHAGYTPTGNESSTFAIALDGGADRARIVGNVVYTSPALGTFKLTEAIRVNAPATIVRGNRIRNADEAVHLYGNASDGEVVSNIAANAQTWGLILSGAQRNTVDKNDVPGAFVSSDSTANVMTNNDFTGHGGFDCWDSSTGDGTGGTANTWTNNLGLGAEPPQICESPGT